MKINLKEGANARQISSIRGQITDANDLKNFDQFLAEREVFDVGSLDDAAAARKCCGGDQCCEITITFEL